jgi:hypothetical protein
MGDCNSADKSANVTLLFSKISFIIHETFTFKFTTFFKRVSSYEKIWHIKIYTFHLDGEQGTSLSSVSSCSIFFAIRFEAVDLYLL